MLSQDKGLKGFTLNILGTDYFVRCVSAKEMPSWYFKEVKGKCDYTVKSITVEDLIERKNEHPDTMGDLESIINQTMRHEILHAFLIESGLGDECSIDEVTVDWFAMQAPKLFKVFCQAKAFSQEELKSCTEAFTAENKRKDENNATTRIANGN